MIPLARPEARWSVAERDRAAEERLISELGVPSLVAAVLAQRGYREPAEADAFLNPSLDNLHDPRLLPDYEAARDCILGAKERGELIFVHGDYDVDGVTSASLLHRFLTSIGCKVRTHVPHRMKEGYGIHASAVEAAKAAGAKVFLTCDCGIGAHEQIAAAREAGMEVVVTDHHTVGHELPDALAVVNPHRADSRYPFAELSGAGVVFKLCEGLTRELDINLANYYRAFLDLAALGTIADVMPLVGENRIIARYGLERIEHTKKVGLRALMNVANVSGPLRGYHVGFVLGPRLNAAGRIDDAALALRLLLESDELAAMQLATQIEEVNASRRSEQQRIIEEAVAMVKDREADKRNVIVIGNEGWHSGVIGIVAGRLVEQFRRPVFVLSIDRESGVAKGSARTIPNFHLADAIRAHPELFLSGGGHAMAAGCSLEADRLDDVADALHAYAGGILTEEDFLVTRRADVEVHPDEITRPAVEALSKLEPFGCENPEPAFVARQVQLVGISPTRNPAHAKLILRHETGPAVNGIAFNLGEQLSQVSVGSTADLLFQPCIDEWKGMRTLKWQVQDFTVHSD